MLSAKYRRLFHYHLKKTGGSTLNQWLDTLTFDDRTYQSSWNWSWLPHERQADVSAPQEVHDNAAASAVSYWSDVVYSHAPIGRYMPTGTFRFTILRNPVERIVSQITDWRRLTAGHTTELAASFGEMIADTNRLSLRDYLQRHGWGEGRMHLDNYMMRALAEGRLGRSMSPHNDIDALLEIALFSLEHDYDLVGLTECHDISHNAICAAIGLPPAGEIPILNRSDTGRDIAAEVADASDVLDLLTRSDWILYRRARALFDQRHRRIGETYDASTFESETASRVLDQLRGTARDEATFYSVRLPIMGSGFHGRDYAGTPACMVWSGPATALTLYIPTPQDVPLSLLVWIRAYAGQQQREQIRVRVDGEPVMHCFATAEGCIDLLTVEARPVRNFVRLEIELDATLTSLEAGLDGHDPRRRGILFEGYGWRLSHLDHNEPPPCQHGK